MRIGKLALAMAVLGITSMAPAASILMDFGSTGQATPVDGLLRTWNTIDYTMGGTTAASLQWSDGTNTGVTYGAAPTVPANATLSMAGAVAFLSSNTAGTGTPTGTAAARSYPGSATGDSVYSTGILAPGAGIDADITLTFSGLSASTPYNLYFFASRSGVGDNRSADYTVTGASTYAPLVLDAANNTGTVVSLMGAVTDATGHFYVSVKPDVANSNSVQYFYLGVGEIEAVPEPASLGILGLGSLALLRRRRA